MGFEATLAYSSVLEGGTARSMLRDSNAIRLVVLAKLEQVLGGRRLSTPMDDGSSQGACYTSCEDAESSVVELAPRVPPRLGPNSRLYINAVRGLEKYL